MDVVHGHGPSPFQTTSPPPRPAIPPKPDKEKIGHKTPTTTSSHAGTQASFRRMSAADASTSTSSSFHAQGDRQAFNFRSPPITHSASVSNASVLNQSPPPPPVPSHQTPISPGIRNKPALPPKPTNPGLLSSPPTTKFPGGKPSPLRIPTATSPAPPDNSSTVSPSPGVVPEVNGNLPQSPPPFLRNKPSSPTSPGLLGADLQFSPKAPQRSPNSRPSSTQFFNFSSPIQNLNSTNFPSTSGGLNQVGGGGRFTSPQKLGEIRVKSASLGRNITFPFSSNASSTPTTGASGIAGIIQRKSATLSKFLPIDLQIGSSQRSPPMNLSSTAAAGKPPKPNSLNLNPFIIQQRMQMQQQHQQRGQTIQNFGRSIAFSPDSPLPPPPPPRLKKKLSPVNSIGSPTSPTSPTSPFMAAPTGPLPPPPVTPLGVFEEQEEAKYGGEGAIYAEIDKEKKWADRKLKSEQSQSHVPQSESSQNDRENSVEHDYSELNGTVKQNQSESASPDTESCETNTNIDKPQDSSESEVVSSWLGKYIQENSTTQSTTLSGNNPFRSTTPTYQSTKTGHIYETIGDPNAVGENETNNNNNYLEQSKEQSEIVEVKESINDDDGLSDNQSFLFKLVINPNLPKKGSEQEKEEPQNQKIEDDEDNEGASFINADEEVQLSPQNDTENGAIEEALNPYLIPTVIQEISSTSPLPPPPPPRQSQPPKVEEEDVVPPPPLEMPPPKDELNTPSRNSSILRRRSWNCDRVDSPSPSESSSTTSSSISNHNQAYHRRDRSYTGLSDKSSRDRDSLLLRESDWIDEGDLSNGVLADAESSDVAMRSSAEDIIHLKNNNKMHLNSSASPPMAPNSKGFRKRGLVNSFFGSFGKGSSSSSTGNSPRIKAAGKGRKDRAVSHIVVGNPQIQVGTKLGRQTSDSILSAGTVISSPIISNSTSFDSGIPSSKPSQSVQFSPDVTETRIIYPEHYSSAEEGLGGEKSSPPELKSGGVSGCGDDESVSSSESVAGSASGSISGYEEILSELSPKEKKSFYVAREILTSERTFVDVLNLLTIDVPKILANAGKFHGQPVVPPEDLNTILGGLPNLKRFNEDLLSDLEERVANWRECPKIADVLVKKGPFLKLYATYIKDFQKNSAHLDTCCQRYPLFAAAIKDFELSERCQKLGLKHYMLKPVQRMPQYRLLLEDYLKSLEKDSEDYEDAVKGITIVKDVAEHANEAIRLQVNAEKLLHLQNRLSSGTIILKADRQLLKEGELQKVCRKELQPRFFALMNDCLLCMTYHTGTGSPKDLKLRYELPLAGMRVQLNPAEDYQNEFGVISVTRSFNVVAKSSKERDEWMKALNNAIHDNIKKRTCSTPDEEMGFQLGKEAPVWVHDSRVTMCQLCTAEFTHFFRRHHCRACGKVVCGNCSGNQAPLQYLQNASHRVCDCCYEYLLDEFDKMGGLSSNDSDRARASLREKFKKDTPNVSKRASKMRNKVPSRLEVNANSSGSKISGYLHWREKEKKSWKKRWFVLIDRVLYIYAASEDIVALKTLPLLGWKVEMDDRPEETEENQAVFKLTHVGHHPILFQAESVTAAEKWMAAMNEAVVL